MVDNMCMNASLLTERREEVSFCNFKQQSLSDKNKTNMHNRFDVFEIY
jgi:hypothetical protein